MAGSAAAGPGPITADGCPVDLYARLPANGEADLVHAALPPGAAILDLGCGTGRVAHGLLALGHPVVGVDQSAEMLAHVRGAETVCAPIADLELGRRFDAVLLASHLINTPDGAERRALLASAERHLRAGGRLIVECHPPSWFDRVAAHPPVRVGEVNVELLDVARSADLLSATVRYRMGRTVWTHAFTARRLSEQDLRSDLAAAGLCFDGWLSADRSWFAAATPPV